MKRLEKKIINTQRTPRFITPVLGSISLWDGLTLLRNKGGNELSQTQTLMYWSSNSSSTSTNLVGNLAGFNSHY